MGDKDIPELHLVTIVVHRFISRYYCLCACIVILSVLLFMVICVAYLMLLCVFVKAMPDSACHVWDIIAAFFLLMSKEKLCTYLEAYVTQLYVGSVLDAFHQSGHISHLITPKLNKAAASWAIVQQKHAQSQCSVTVCLKFRLFQSILAPAFHYGCPVEGVHSPTDSAADNIRKQLEQKYMLYLKRLWGVPATTSHAVILAGLNMRSLKHFWWQQTIACWNAWASAPASCLHRLVLIDVFRMRLFMVFIIFLVSLSLPSQCWLPFTYPSPKYSCHRCQHNHSWT